MAIINPKTFPGVYTSITDNSFVQPATSRFRPGLIGATTKGSFNTATTVRSLKEFVRVFGTPLTTVYNTDGSPQNKGYFLADAISILADTTDGVSVVRVGNQYTPLTVSDGSGASGGYSFSASQASQMSVGNYVRISQDGKNTTVEAKISAISFGTNVTLDSTVLALQDTYSAATVSYSATIDAANKAESILYAYSYGTNAAGADVALSTVGIVTGNKNDHSFTVASAGSNVVVGNVYKIKTASATKVETQEVRVKSVAGNTVYIETSGLTQVGYQSLPLQDSYVAGDSARLYLAAYKTPFIYLEALTEGTWANGANSTVGLFVRVRPGSSAGTKKIEVYWNSALVETFDNLSDDSSSSSANWYVTRINGNSQYIRIKNTVTPGGGQKYHAANTAAPWDSNYAVQNLSGSLKSMPVGAINAGGTYGGGFTGGKNGSLPQDSDFIGTISATDDTPTGLKCFDDLDNVNVNFIAAPGDLISRGVLQEMNRVAKRRNAVAIADVPFGLNGRLAIDWHNGAGQFSSSDPGRIDAPNLAVYWNWGKITDTFTGLPKFVPPTIGVLRCLSYTFNRDKPWSAAAGEIRGVIPEFIDVQFRRLSEDTKQAMYGNGNSVNPIMSFQNGTKRVLFGERTMQVAESKLSVVHNVVLVNYIVEGMSAIARRYVFEPNDAELLTVLKLAFTEFLDKIKNERGIENPYDLVMDNTNNNADTRNQRQVIVDLAIIPVDAVERIFINVSARQSGASLLSLASS